MERSRSVGLTWDEGFPLRKNIRRRTTLQEQRFGATQTSLKESLFTWTGRVYIYYLVWWMMDKFHINLVFVILNWRFKKTKWTPAETYCKK